MLRPGDGAPNMHLAFHGVAPCVRCATEIVWQVGVLYERPIRENPCFISAFSVSLSSLFLRSSQTAKHKREKSGMVHGLAWRGEGGEDCGHEPR